MYAILWVYNYCNSCESPSPVDSTRPAAKQNTEVSQQIKAEKKKAPKQKATKQASPDMVCNINIRVQANNDFNI